MSDIVLDVDFVVYLWIAYGIFYDEWVDIEWLMYEYTWSYYSYIIVSIGYWVLLYIMCIVFFSIGINIYYSLL